MTDIVFYAQFTASKLGVNSLTVTWDIERITRADGTRTALVTGGATNVIVGRRGLYGYRLAGADIISYDYVATAITADTSVDAREVAALWTFWAADWHDVAASALTVVGSIGKRLADMLDAAISTRLAAADYISPDNATIGALDARLPAQPAAVSDIPSLAQIAGAVWGWASRTLTSLGTLAADVWAYPTRTLTMTAVQIDETLRGREISVIRGDTVQFDIQDLGAIGSRLALYWTVKYQESDTDGHALMQISEDDGLVTFLGQPASDPLLAQLSVLDPINGTLRVWISPQLSAQLPTVRFCVCDIQVTTSGGVVHTLFSGHFNVLADVTRRLV